MAYTIKIFDTNTTRLWDIERLVRTAIDDYDVRDYRTFLRSDALVIEMRTIRLKPEARKEYCGQHAGPCVLPRIRPKPRGVWLEASDWIAFHNLINRALDACRAKAHISTSSRGDTWRVKGMVNKYIIRTPELGGRKLWQYADCRRPGTGFFQLPQYLFNPGTADQFGVELPYTEHDEEISYAAVEESQRAVR